MNLPVSQMQLQEKICTPCQGPACSQHFKELLLPTALIKDFQSGQVSGSPRVIGLLLGCQGHLPLAQLHSCLAHRKDGIPDTRKWQHTFPEIKHVKT